MYCCVWELIKVSDIKDTEPMYCCAWERHMFAIRSCGAYALFTMGKIYVYWKIAVLLGTGLISLIVAIVVVSR